jgi:hypothetical protein
VGAALGVGLAEGAVERLTVGPAGVGGSSVDGRADSIGTGALGVPHPTSSASAATGSATRLNLVITAAPLPAERSVSDT